MAEDFQEKTEDASSKKLSEGRKKGQVAKSQDFTASLVLFSTVVSMGVFGAFMWDKLDYMTRLVFNNLLFPFDDLVAVDKYFREGIILTIIASLPVLLAAVLAGLASNLMQFGFLLSLEPLMPKWKNLNIFNPERWKKFCNLQAIMRLLFGLAKLTVIGIVCYLMILRTLPRTSQLMKESTAALFAYMMWQCFLVALVVVLILVVLGAAEFIYQKWKFASDQKMSKQEVKDERKQSEGDPVQKGRLRSMMYAFAQGRMKQNVPLADVVIANPTHYAIALKYDPEEMAAPVCVAKGARRMALRIKELAGEAKVPIVENRTVAQGLFRTVEVGRPIPPEFYHAVAEVLAYVYRLNAKVKGEAS